MKKFNEIIIKLDNTGNEISIDSINKNKSELNGKEVEIRCNKVKGISITGKSIDYINNDIIFPISYNYTEYLFFPINLREHTDYTIEIRLHMSKHEAIKSKNQSLNNLWPFSNVNLMNVLTLDDNKYWSERDGKVIIRGRVNFKDYVGIVDFSLLDEELFIEVVSHKIDYTKDFKTIIEDISESIVNISVYCGSTSDLGFTIDDRSEATLYTKVFYLKKLFKNDNLSSAIEYIVRNPYSKLVQEHCKTKIQHAKNHDINMIIAKASQLDYVNGGPLKNKFRGYTPVELIESNKYDTYDVLENRYVKFFLQGLLIDCYDILDLVQNKYSNDKKQSNRMRVIEHQVNIYIDKINEWLDYRFWREVSDLKYIPTNSQVIQKREGYRNVLKNKLEYDSSIKINLDSKNINDIIYGGIKPVYELYEIWCYFEIRKLFTECLGFKIKDDIIRIKEDKINIDLKKGNSSKISFVKNEEYKNLQIELYYNKKFTNESGSYSFDFTPDYTVKITRIDTKEYLFIHFDAKYRIENSNSEKGTKGAKHENIEKMHAYLDAINNSIGSYVLYPGSKLEIYKKNSKEIIPGVGAFPLRINNKEDKEKIIEYLKNVLLKINTEIIPKNNKYKRRRRFIK
ncbi:MAG: DUF2357 domain-containing protein [Paeniclostridium sordellii]|nr:DUF2357 domain-containing protein [Paeniclostridium sordellii]